MAAKYNKIKITEEYLNADPNAFFVYGDNLQRQGNSGSSILRGHPRSIGFVTRKAPQGVSGCTFKPHEYISQFFGSLKQLEEHVGKNPARTFYISKLGAGKANKYYIWELIIKPNLTTELGKYSNVIFCWSENE